VLAAICATFVVIHNESLKRWVLTYVDKASSHVCYVVQDIEIRNQNSSEYCIDLTNEGILKDYYGQSLFTVSLQNLAAEVGGIDCVDTVQVRKVFPSGIQVMVSYQEPIAIWLDKREFRFVTRDGNLMRILSDKGLNKFVLIIGSDAPSHVPALIKFLSQSSELYSKIERAVWIGGRRWDVIFQDGCRVMLPEDQPELAWNKFVNLQRDHPDFAPGKYKTIDLRVAGKIYAS
jgi:cell division protein FtsQ